LGLELFQPLLLEWMMGQEWLEKEMVWLWPLIVCCSKQVREKQGWSLFHLRQAWGDHVLGE
jgi:hypothetical protein